MRWTKGAETANLRWDLFEINNCADAAVELLIYNHQNEML